MSQEQRKATDVLLDLETKVNMLLDMVRSQELANKIISNKLNDLMAKVDKQQSNKITVEAVQNFPLPASNLPPGFNQLPAGESERNIPFVAENSLPQTDSPQGFRRTSRPETFVNDRSLQVSEQKPTKAQSQKSMMPPPGRSQNSVSEIIAPPEATLQAPSNKQEQAIFQDDFQKVVNNNQNTIPVMQRCVDKNGKSIFLADVKIIDLSNENVVVKTKTNGMGKFMAALNVGSYRVEIKKLGSSLKDKIEAVQDIHIDGSQSKVELPMLIIK